MSLRNPLLIILTICIASTVTAFETESPVVGDWKNATNHDGLVRIPLQNPRGHSWFAALRMGTPLQYPQFCAIDSNHALSVVFSKDCASCVSDRPFVYDQDHSSTFMQKRTKSQIVQDDGFQVEGYLAADDMCLGMFGNKKQYENPETTVCMANQIFLLAEGQSDWNWGARATDGKHIDAVCGLGKEKSSMNAQGWLARAAHSDKIKHVAYSITLVPQKLALPIAMDPTIPSDRTEEELMQTSFLTLGGYDEKDLAGPVTWFDAKHTWNQTLTEFSFDGRPIIESYEQAQVMIETGYPYIGMTEQYFDKIADYLKQSVSRQMECTKGLHWGMCRVADRRCDELTLNFDLKFTMNDYEFTIPLENIAVYVNQTGTMYCQTQIALLAQSHNAVVLGGAFFTSFVGIFDVENEKIGFAESARALPGSSIQCVGPSCGLLANNPDDSSTSSKSGRNALAALLILAGLIVTILICFGLYQWRKRANRTKGESILATKGGFQLRDDSEEEEVEEDPNMNLTCDIER